MPKSNVVFWENKFAENIQRDRNKIKELANNGFRVFVVWECELLKHTVETIRRVAFWIKQEPGQYDYVVNRKKLLAVAEQKVQHRIALYDLKSALSNIGKNEGQEK